VLWTVVLEYGTRFELLFTPSTSPEKGNAPEKPVMSGIRLVVGGERVHYVHHS